MLADFAFREIKRRKIQSLTNIIGYAFAIGILIITITLAQGYNIVASGELRGIGTHFVAYIPGSGVCPCEEFIDEGYRIDVGPYFRGVYTPTFDSNLVEKIETIDGVEDAAPYIAFRFEDLTIGGIEVESIATEANVISKKTIVSGRYLKQNDNNCLIVDQVYANVYNLTVGDQIHVFGKTFKIVGIADPGSHSFPAGVFNMYGLIDEVQELVKSYGEQYHFAVNEINVVLVEISSIGDSEYIDEVKKTVLEILEFDVGTKGNIAGYQCGVKARSVISLNEDGAWIISSVILLAATLYCARSQISTVFERTKEIGVLKSLGWTNLDITKQALIEAVFQTSLGGFIGLIFGYCIIILTPILGFFTTENLVLSVSPGLLLVGLFCAISGGTIAGILSAWQAAKLKPAEALRHI